MINRDLVVVFNGTDGRRPITKMRRTVMQVEQVVAGANSRSGETIHCRQLSFEGLGRRDIDHTMARGGF